MSSNEGRKGKSEDIRRETERGAGRRGRVWVKGNKDRELTGRVYGRVGSKESVENFFRFYILSNNFSLPLPPLYSFFYSRAVDVISHHKLANHVKELYLDTGN